ncbi:tripartite tricarboxylate transporter substrate binding protein [Variovorax sp. Sphag1AA]|uniref:Bug family tripartite tricarboxylate transporter substrate binding protein n=1 Tax=Variovorax sp. Sphag1AA TaxID=2587027 RepID=UPI00161E6EB3|nr:tripartite tricarboxylate transporter substrate binding protein [Variovorax sp. Sphag1AA]MBB3181127.1 tripartite-type tricarboxylate transporter receptor subunit TctC [Variovorax sp. Sphag1AA]
MKRRQFLAALSAAPVAVPRLAFAQDFPAKPIRLIVPFAAGGPTDALGRGFALLLSEVLKQQVIVDNKGGAGGNIGIDMVAKAAPDGYTIGLGTNGPLAGNLALFKSMPYDPARDLAPIARLAFVPNVIAIHPAVPAKTLADLIALLKAEPDRYSFASGGNGTTSHLAGEYLKVKTGTRMTHVPYKGDGPGLSDALGGQIPIIIASVTATAPYVHSGKLRALAVTSAQRMPSLPDVPTVAEAARLTGFDFSAWYALVGPARMPPEIVSRLSAASLQVAESRQMSDRLATLGGVPAPMNAEQLGKYIRAEIPRMAQVIKETGARAD